MLHKIFFFFIILLATHTTSTFEIAKTTAKLITATKKMAKQISTTTQIVATEFKNDLQGAADDAKEIAHDIATNIKETFKPAVNVVIQTIKDPIEDLPDVLEEIQEAIAAGKKKCSDALQPIRNTQEKIRLKINTIMHNLKITVTQL